MADHDHDAHDEEPFFSGFRRCDWRVGIDHNCPDPEFFDVVYAIFLAFTVATLVVQLLVVAFRIFFLKDTRASFKQGDNAALIFFILSQLFNLVLSAGLVSHSIYRITAEVFWCLSQTVYFGPIFINLHAIIGATPGLKITEFKVPAVFLNDRVRGVFLIFHFFIINATFVTFMALTDHLENTGAHDTAYALWQSGLVIQSIFLLANIVAMSFFTYHFKSAANERLKSIHADLKEEKEEYEVLRLTLAKSNRMYYDSLAIGPLGIVIYLTLAYYSGFFNNLLFSKAAAAILYVGFTAPAFFVTLGYAYVDLRKYQLMKHRTHSAGNSSSHRNDVKMAPGRDDTTSPDPIQEFLDRAA